ncbi:MAG: hypothetical protein HY280_00390 [Nitrospinae bacterium]|nr:hypothetical protein [Nitrospinota bacterium]
MKKILVAIIFLFIPTVSFADDWDLSVNVVEGTRTLSYPSSNAWSATNIQPVGDIRFEAMNKAWPATLVIGTSSSTSQNKICDAANNISCQSGVSELYFGGLKYFGDSGFHPYFGGGLSFVSATGTGKWPKVS